MPTVLLDRPATDPVLAAAEFKSDLHPRGPGGRFTKSFTKALTAAERKRADKAQAAFKAQEFDAASLKQWQGTHTPAQFAAIKRFTGGDWKTINGDLRAGHDTQHPDIAQLDASMHPLPHDVTLHRTVPLALFGGVDPAKLSGRKVKDAGYASTSIHQPTPGGGAVVRMHISAPAGTPAMPTGENGEVVLPRDQEMVIESVKADGHGGYDMQVTILPKAGTRAPATPKPAKKTAPEVEPSPAPKAVPPAKKPPSKRATPKRTAPAPTPKPAPPRSEPAKEPAPSPASPSELEAFAADTGHGKTTVKLAGGMSAETSLVTLADGRQAVFKRAPEWGDPNAPKTQADAEHLASLVAAAIGAPAPGVVKDGDDAVWMAYVHGKTAGQILDTGTPDERAQYRALLDGPDGVRLGLLDVLVGNAERNDGNSIMSDGKLFGIDHGFSWEMYSDEPGVDQLGGDITGRPVQHFVGRDEQGRWQLVDNPLTQADITEARQQLDALRPQFRAAGREKWLDRSVKMLNALAPHAKGAPSERAESHAKVEGRDVTEDIAALRGAADYAEEHPFQVGRHQGHADPMMGGLAQQVGFDGRPEHATAARIQEEIDRGGLETWRGVQPVVRYGKVVLSAQEMADSYRTGEVWYGLGGGANGIYSTTAEETAGRYAGNEGAFWRIVLRADARTIGHVELAELHQEWMTSGRRRKGRREDVVLDDPGRYAMALGYDAILAPLSNPDGTPKGESYVVILNRTATLVEEQ